MGGIAGCAIGSMINMPAIIHIPLTLIAGLIGGMVAGAIPGFLKAFTGGPRSHRHADAQLRGRVLLGLVLLSTAFQLPGQSNDISRTMYSSAQLAPLFGVSSGLRVSYGVFIGKPAWCGSRGGSLTVRRSASTFVLRAITPTQHGRRESTRDGSSWWSF